MYYRIGSVVFIDTLSFMQFKVEHFFYSKVLNFDVGKYLKNYLANLLTRLG